MKGKAIKICTAAATVCLAGGLLALFPACGGEKLPEGVHATYWDGKATFTVNTGASSYDVYRSDTKDGEFVKVGSCNGTYKDADPYAYYRFDAKGESTEPFSYIYSSLGENVRVYSPLRDESAIQEEIDRIYRRTIWDEFSDDRYSFLFLPGEYESVTAKPGYYTTVAGLGYLPTDVTLKDLEKKESPIASGSLVNFWCGAENFSVTENADWCVSQATSLRRMNFAGDLALDNGGYSSGGFLADSKVAGKVTNSTQQQWFTRNSELGSWTKSDINMVFAGVTGDIPKNEKWPSQRVTVLNETPRAAEKPFLVFDEKEGYGVYLPFVRENGFGVSWKDGAGDGVFLGLQQFYLANAKTDTAKTLNDALKAGKNILFAPGVYEIEAPLTVEKDGTVLFGTGLATLRTQEGNTDTCLRVTAKRGVSVSGLLIDAGTVTNTLMEVGETGDAGDYSADPICLNDLFFRMGGFLQKTTGADQTLVINTNDVIGDNFWLWRADHGMDATVLEPYFSWETGLASDAAAKTDWSFWKSFGVGWKGAENNNYGRNGAVIHGDRVHIYGLMVEHFGEYQTIWDGEDGLMCFYQSETPYDAKNQSEWTCTWQGKDYEGYASYKVGDDVKKHTAYGIGVYYVRNDGLPVVVLDHAIECPVSDTIKLFHLATANFKGVTGCGIRNILSVGGTNYGGSNVVPYSQQKVPLTSYEDGKVTK